MCQIIPGDTYRALLSVQLWTEILIQLLEGPMTAADNLKTAAANEQR